jgi:hypothetical protein
MNENYEVRKLPLKTKIILIVLSVLAILVYLLQENTKELTAKSILYNLGYKDISQLEVYSKTEVEDTTTRVQGFKYFITFTNTNTQQKCRGFILKNFKRELSQDISCK